MSGLLESEQDIMVQGGLKFGVIILFYSIS